MKKENYFYIFWKTIVSSYGLICTILSFGLAFIFWICSPTDSVSMSFFLIIVSVLVFLLCLFIRFSIILYELEKNQKITILHILKPKGIYKDFKALILVDENSNLSQNSLVTIYNKENSYESCISLGKVVNIQEDGKIQILVLDGVEDDFEWDKYFTNGIDNLNRIVIKPIITTDFIKGVQYV